MQETIGIMDAFSVAGDLGANNTGRVAMIGRAVHAADPVVAQQLDVERTGRRTIVRTDRMANGNLGSGVHGHPSRAAIPAPRLNEFAAMANKCRAEEMVGRSRTSVPGRSIGSDAVNQAAMVRF